MGCNFYLHKKDHSKWLIPNDGIGMQLEMLVADVVTNNKVDINDGLMIDLTKCLTEVEGLHIGKSSMGWYFSLCIYPTLNIYSYNDWLKLFNSEDYYIIDEYGEDVTPTQMIDCIAYRKQLNWDKYKDQEEFEKECLEEINNISAYVGSDEQFDTFQEWLDFNSALRGKFGLIRHKSSIWNPRDDSKWQGFLPMFNNYYYDDFDGTFDLTLNWNFS